MTTPISPRVPRKPRSKPSTQAEVVTPFDNAPLDDHPFNVAQRAAQEQAAPEPKTVEPETEPLPPSLLSALGQVIALLPESEQGKANTVLAEAVQKHLARVSAAYNAQASKEMAELRAEWQARAQQAIEAKLQEIAKAAGPTNPEEMQTLVSQEYLRFPVKVEYPDEDGEFKELSFVIREVPQAVEKRMVKALTVELIPLMGKLQGIRFTPNSTNADKLQQAIRAVPEILSILAELTVICLNPLGKREGIDKAWVENNVSSSRMANILEAQFMANRIRDFFSGVSRLIPRT